MLHVLSSLLESDFRERVFFTGLQKAQEHLSCALGAAPGAAPQPQPAQRRAGAPALPLQLAGAAVKRGGSTGTEPGPSRSSPRAVPRASCSPGPARPAPPRPGSERGRTPRAGSGRDSGTPGRPADAPTFHRGEHNAHHLSAANGGERSGAERGGQEAGRGGGPGPRREAPPLPQQQPPPASGEPRRAAIPRPI